MKFCVLDVRFSHGTSNDGVASFVSSGSQRRTRKTHQGQAEHNMAKQSSLHGISPKNVPLDNDILDGQTMDRSQTII